MKDPTPTRPTRRLSAVLHTTPLARRNVRYWAEFARTGEFGYASSSARLRTFRKRTTVGARLRLFGFYPTGTTTQLFARLFESVDPSYGRRPLPVARGR